VLAGLTRPQLFLAVCLPFGVWHIVRQTRRGAYRGLWTAPAHPTVNRQEAS
jgi:hypothetical protein